MSNDFLNMTNSQIRENSRWLKDFKSNLNKPSANSSADSSTNSSTNSSATTAASAAQSSQASAPNMLGMMQMMLMMMMYQMFGGNMSQLSGMMGAPSSSMSAQSGLDPFSSFPNYRPASTTSSSDGSTTTQKALDAMMNSMSTPPQGPEDLNSLEDNWFQAGFDKTQLGQTVMYALHQGSDDTANAVANWLAPLISANDINPLPLLSPDYLSKLDNNRLDLLSSSLASTGLSDDAGAPNSALISHLMSKATGQATDDASSLEQAMARDAIYKLASQEPDNPYLGNMLQLMGFSQDSTGAWSGPFELAPQFVADTAITSDTTSQTTSDEAASASTATSTPNTDTALQEETVPNTDATV